MTTVSPTTGIGYAKVMHEEMDGEIVIINVDSGSYYSLKGTGMEIWGLIGDGTTGERLAAQIGMRYAGTDQEITTGVQALLDRLFQENLISEKPLADMAEAADPDGPVDAAAKPDFVAPQLEAYHDMQDLLLLDPIHDVDQTGWPNLPNDG